MVEEASDGRIQFDRTDFETICPLNEVVECLRDGRADIGATVTDYTPQVLPTLTVVGIPFMNTDILATTAALYDTHMEYAPAVEALEQNNLQYVATWPVGSMFIGSNEPVESMDDLDGLSVRASGQATQMTIEAAGASITAVTAPETYEALQRGVINSVAAALDFTVNYGVAEQLAYWAEPGWGQYNSYGMWWSRSAYDSLPEDLQTVVDEVIEELNYGEATAAYNEQVQEVCKGMLESPDVEDFSGWSEEATEEWRDAVIDDAESLWLDLVDDYGLENGQEYLDEYRAAYDSHASGDNPLDGAVDCVDQWQEQNS